MFQHPAQESTQIETIRSLNLPKPLVVEADERLLPRAVELRERRRRVEAIPDSWRIDDEWWRAPISRRYFQIILEGGIARTIYQDLVSGGWYEQSY
jgi:hypothetical protein